MTVQTLHIRFLVSHWLKLQSPAVCAWVSSRLLIASCRLLGATEIMTNTLLYWDGPRWEIKHPYKLKGLPKNNLVDLCGLSVFPFCHPLLPLSLSSLEGVPCIPPFRLSFPAHNLNCPCPSYYWVKSKPASTADTETSRFFFRLKGTEKNFNLNQLSSLTALEDIKLEWNRGFSSRYSKILLAYLPRNPLC